MTSTPLVSVIIPTYYRNDRLSDALDSLNRTEYDHIETVVVDDSGENYAEPVVEGYDVIYVSLDRNRGQNAALNRGLEEISGDYVQFLDDDDEVFSGKFAKQVKLLESSPDVGVAYCGIENDDGAVSLPSKDGRGDVLKQVLTFELDASVTSTLLIDRECIDQISPLPTPSGSTDIYMKIELAQITNFDFISEPLVYKHNSAESMGDSAAAIEGNRAVFERYREVYNRFNESVRRTALANFCNRAGRYYISERRWSLQAVGAFWKATYHMPGISLPFFGRFVGSIFGRPGVTAVEAGMTRIKTMV